MQVGAARDDTPQGTPLIPPEAGPTLDAPEIRIGAAREALHLVSSMSTTPRPPVQSPADGSDDDEGVAYR